jgi:enolase
MRVVFSLATCHLFDDDYDYEFDLETIQEILIDEYDEIVCDYRKIYYDEDGFRDEVIDWETLENECNPQLADILVELKNQNRI